MGQPTLDEYCLVLANAVIVATLGVELPEHDPEVQKILQHLKNELVTNYAKQGYPYGETEEDHVRYLLDILTIEVES